MNHGTRCRRTGSGRAPRASAVADPRRPRVDGRSARSPGSIADDGQGRHRGPRRRGRRHRPHGSCGGLRSAISVVLSMSDRAYTGRRWRRTCDGRPLDFGRVPPGRLRARCARAAGGGAITPMTQTSRPRRPKVPASFPGWLRRLAAIGWRLLAAVALGYRPPRIALLLSTVTASILVAAIVAATFAPFVLALRRRGWSRIKAAAAVFLGAGAVILATIGHRRHRLPARTSRSALESLGAGLTKLKGLLADANIPPEVGTAIDHATQGLQAWISASVSSVVGSLGVVATIGDPGDLPDVLLPDGRRQGVDVAMSSASSWRRDAIDDGRRRSRSSGSAATCAGPRSSPPSTGSSRGSSCGSSACRSSRRSRSSSSSAGSSRTSAASSRRSSSSSCTPRRPGSSAAIILLVLIAS